MRPELPATASTDWHEVRLGDLIQIKHGWPFKSDQMSADLTGRPIVVNIGNFRYSGGFRFATTTIREYRGEYPSAYELTPGDILLVMTCQTAGGEILGIPARIPDDGRTYLHNQRLGRVVVKERDRVDPDFLYWVFLNPSFNRELYLSASGTKILHTSPFRIESAHICLPALDEQRAIAHILGTLDDKIELNRRMNETLEGIARALFKSWFVDFDPVRAKAEGREPYGMDAETAALFPDSFEDSELGPIPSGWRVRSLDEIAEFLNGLALQKYPARDRSSLPIIKIAQIHTGNTLGADVASAELPSEYVVEDGDVLFSWSGSLECVIWTGGRGALNQHLFKVTSKEFPKWFYYLWIHQHLTEFRSVAAGKATTMGHIQRHHLSDAKVVVPSGRLLAAADSIIRPIFDSLVSRSLEARTIEAVRDTQLPKLLSGSVRIRFDSRCTRQSVTSMQPKEE